MLRFTALLGILLLSGCQSSNPYQAQSMPTPAVSGTSANPLDLSAYPAASRDFSQYRSWRWQQLPSGQSWGSSEQLAQVFAGGLEQHGLRPATTENADLLMSASSQLEQRVYDRYPEAGYYFGQGHRAYGRRYGSHGLYGQVPLGSSSYEQEFVTVFIELIDAQTGQRVWSGQAAANSGDSNSKRMQAMRAAVEQALSQLP